MSKAAIHTARSTNCISWVPASNPAHRGMESAKVSSETASATARTVAPPRSPPASSSTHRPPAIGVHTTRLKSGGSIIATDGLPDSDRVRARRYSGGRPAAERGVRLRHGYGHGGIPVGAPAPSGGGLPRARRPHSRTTTNSDTSSLMIIRKNGLGERVETPVLEGSGRRSTLGPARGPMP